MADIWTRLYSIKTNKMVYTYNNKANLNINDTLIIIKRIKNKPRLKKGMKCFFKCCNGEQYILEFDKNIGGHSNYGLSKRGSCYNFTLKEIKYCFKKIEYNEV